VTDHIVTSFSEELEQLSTNVSKMGGLAEAQLQSAIDAITRRDMALADRTVSQDQQLDDLEILIEENAVELIALRQPMALDLREAMTAIKIAADLCSALVTWPKTSQNGRWLFSRTMKRQTDWSRG